MLAVGGVAAIDAYAAASATFPARVGPVRDYSARSGFPKPAAEMRGIARRPGGRRAATPANAVYTPS
jgi:hypothetical protein